jgi:hypothetical protein
MNSSVAKVKSVSFGDNFLTITLVDGRIIQAPLGWYPTLFHATKAQLKSWKPCGAGRGIHWPAIDYHLSVEGLLRGEHEAEGLSRRTLAHVS